MLLSIPGSAHDLSRATSLHWQFSGLKSGMPDVSAIDWLQADPHSIADGVNGASNGACGALENACVNCPKTPIKRSHMRDDVNV
jgi:hypothetical protein